MKIAEVIAFLEQLAPVRTAEDWDNVGLLVGRRDAEVARAMTCLTVTPASAAEAIAAGVQLIVTHHPLPFHGMKQINSDTVTGRLLLDLIAGGVAVYSAHTAFDSAGEGINQRLAAGLELCDIRPLRPQPDGSGAGRFGRLDAPTTLATLAARLKRFLRIEHLHWVGRPEQPVATVAVACGAADEFLDLARRNYCDALLLGEARFHTCLEAEATGVGLLLPGHFASERFGLEHLAESLSRQFPALNVWPSREERDPLHWE
jgi:dinuclear metal center YbgI/SA1388 family protein